MKVLVIDTATTRGVLALVEGERVHAQVDLAFGNQNSTYLVPKLQELGVDFKTLDCIAVGVGPGSYTGIRVGVCVAKTLSYACQIPLVGVCTLQGLIPSNGTSFTAIIDAKISGVYVLEGRCGEPFVLPVDKLQAMERVITPHCEVLKRKIQAPVAHWEERGPDPVQMARIALEKRERGEFSTDGTVDILYLRKTQAELRVAG